MRSLRPCLTILCVLASACELQEVQVAQPQDLVLAEVVLRAGASTQQAWLHRTRGSGHAPRVDSAIVEVRAANGALLRYEPAHDTVCVQRRMDTQPGTHGSCYTSRANALAIQPGQSYSLTITLPGGARLTGATTVPQDFRMLRPAVGVCSIPAMTPLELRWTRAPGSWVYVSETNLRNIKNALMPYNLTVDSDPLRIWGLSLSAADTTIVFPGELGVIDRFDEDRTAALALLQRGLPAGIIADVVVAATDRNYVNWERGGAFNPSGPVRVPSIRGDGTGVFGSIVPKTFQIRVNDPARPPC